MSGIPSQYYTTGGAIVGAIPFLLGINALVRPTSVLSMLNVTPPKDLEDQKKVRGLIQMYGARDISMGAAILVGWYFGNPTTFGWIVLASLPMVLVDGYVSKELTGGGEWQHWPMAPVMAGVGAGLLGWI